MQPTLTVIPARALSTEPQATDLLVRITPPQTGGRVPPLDLVLTLDTSGSMGGLPLTLACQAAALVKDLCGDARLELARTQRRVAQLVDRGHLPEAHSRLSEARRKTVELRNRGIGVGTDAGQLERLEASLRRGDRKLTSKLARSEAYLTSSVRKKA